MRIVAVPRRHLDRNYESLASLGTCTDALSMQQPGQSIASAATTDQGALNEEFDIPSLRSESPS